jgi:uncharacterized protein YukE
MDWNINGDIMKVLDMVGLPMPGGNGGVLRQIAREWTAMAGAIETQVGILDRAVSAVVPAEWTGDAADAFRQHWQTQSAQVSQGVNNFKQVANGLTNYAGTVDSINEEILSIAEQIIAASVAGAVLTFVTAGISDLVAGAADAAEVSRIAALIVKFTELAEKIGKDLEEVGKVVEDVLAKLKDMTEFLKGSKLGRAALSVGKFGMGVGKDLTTNFIADSGANVASQYLSGQKVTWGSDLENGALDAAGTVATAGLLSPAAGKLGSMATAGLANVGGGIFQSEFGGKANGDSAFELPTNGAAVSQDLQNLEGAAADGLGGAAAHDGSTFVNGKVFTLSDTLGSLTTTTETSSTQLKQLLTSFDGGNGAMPVDQ